jgi:hypothetical protein
MSPRARRLVGLGVGVALLAGAAVAVLANADAILRLRSAVGGGTLSAWALLGLVLLPIGNWVITSACFHFLTRPRARVTAGEQFALVGASWLLNYLPLSAGLLARVAYMKHAHGLRVRDSGRIVVESIACGWVAALALLVAAAQATPNPCSTSSTTPNCASQLLTSVPSDLLTTITTLFVTACGSLFPSVGIVSRIFYFSFPFSLHNITSHCPAQGQCMHAAWMGKNVCRVFYLQIACLGFPVTHHRAPPLTAHRRGRTLASNQITMLPANAFARYPLLTSL